MSLVLYIFARLVTLSLKLRDGPLLEGSEDLALLSVPLTVLLWIRYISIVSTKVLIWRYSPCDFTVLFSPKGTLWASNRDRLRVVDMFVGLTLWRWTCLYLRLSVKERLSGFDDYKKEYPPSRKSLHGYICNWIGESTSTEHKSVLTNYDSINWMAWRKTLLSDILRRATPDGKLNLTVIEQIICVYTSVALTPRCSFRPDQYLD